MITALVLVGTGVEALAVTLAALVPGVAQGLVADAVVLVRRADDDVARVADATGATLVTVPAGADPWRAGADAARRDWLFCLADGDIPAEGWIRAVDRFILTAGGDPPLGRPGRERSWRERAALLGEGRFRAPRVRPGDLVHRASLAAAPRRLVRLQAQILRDPG